MSASLKPIETPQAQRVADFKRRTLPLIVWSLSGLIVFSLIGLRTRHSEYVGMAFAPQYEISATSTGRLKSVAVGLYDQVAPGDVIARMDEAEITASVKTLNASVIQLRAELEARRVELLSSSGQELADWTADLRRFQIDEERRRLESLSLRVVIESDQIEKERLTLELRRARPLRESGLMSELELESLQLQHDQLERQLRENRVLLDQTEEEYRTAQARRRDYESDLPRQPGDEPLLQPLKEAINVEIQRLAEIELQRAGMVLRSPVHGQVSAVLCRQGQTVVPGEPIVTISGQSVEEIVAYLGEGDRRHVDPNSAVLIENRSRPGHVAESVVLRVAPAIETLPQRLWRNPTIPEYGRAVVVARAPGMTLAPGELVNVHFRGGE